MAEIFVSLLHFIAPALNLTAQLADGGSRDCNKGIKFKKGAFNCALKHNNYFLFISECWLCNQLVPVHEPVPNLFLERKNESVEF